MRTAYLDIETDYIGAFSDQRLFRDHKNHRITVLGIRVLGLPNDSREAQASLGFPTSTEANDQFVQLVGESGTRKRLLEALAGVAKIVTYNGRSMPDEVKRSVGFDFPVIAAQLDVVLDREFAHTDLVPECWKRNLYGGLKEVERKLGLARQLPGKDGLWANQTWRKYCETRDQALLDQLLQYNREDVFMLREVELKLATIPVPSR